MQKINCLFLFVVMTGMLTGCGGLAPSYLYKQGATPKSTMADYKDCQFKSQGVNQNTGVAQDLSQQFSKEYVNSKATNRFMDLCMNQKGYEWYNFKLMEKFGFDKDFYENSQHGFFHRNMTVSEIDAYAKNGSAYHFLDANTGKERLWDEEFVRKGHK